MADPAPILILLVGFLSVQAALVTYKPAMSTIMTSSSPWSIMESARL